MSPLGVGFVLFGWVYAFLILVVDRSLDPKNEFTFDAVLEAVAFVLTPRLLSIQFLCSCGLYFVGSRFFGWVVGVA